MTADRPNRPRRSGSSNRPTPEAAPEATPDAASPAPPAALGACFECGRRAVTATTVDETIEFSHEGAVRSFDVTAIPVRRCGACGAVDFTTASDRRIREAVRDSLGLLQPASIRDARKRLKLTQTELADALGCAAETISRWENGAVIQSRAYDRWMRAYFALPDLRGFFATLTERDDDGTVVIFAEEHQATDESGPVLWTHSEQAVDAVRKRASKRARTVASSTEAEAVADGDPTAGRWSLVGSDKQYRLDGDAFVVVNVDDAETRSDSGITASSSHFDDRELEREIA